MPPRLQPDDADLALVSVGQLAQSRPHAGRRWPRSGRCCGRAATRGSSSPGLGSTTARATVDASSAVNPGRTSTGWPSPRPRSAGAAVRRRRTPPPRAATAASHAPAGADRRCGLTGSRAGSRSGCARSLIAGRRRAGSACRGCRRRTTGAGRSGAFGKSFEDVVLDVQAAVGVPAEQRPAGLGEAILEVVQQEALHPRPAGGQQLVVVQPDVRPFRPVAGRDRTAERDATVLGDVEQERVQQRPADVVEGHVVAVRAPARAAARRTLSS